VLHHSRTDDVDGGTVVEPAVPVYAVFVADP
jgi:hypothetical protein